MKQDRNVPQTRGYRFTPDSRPALRLTAKGIAFVEDCNAKLGAIAEDENLPRPTTEKSHADLVNEEIALYEQETAKKAEKPQKNMLSKGDKLDLLMNCSERLSKRYRAFFKIYESTPENDYKSRKAAFVNMERVHNADSRVMGKITELLTGKAPIFSPCPAQFLGTLKNSQLKAAHEEAHAMWVNYWDSDLPEDEAAYGEISERLNLINDEIERRERRG